MKRVEVDASRDEVREVRVARFLFREKARRGISLSPLVSAAAHFFPSRKCSPRKEARVVRRMRVEMRRARRGGIAPLEERVDDR